MSGDHDRDPDHAVDSASISGDGEHALRPDRRWAWVGSTACAVLLALDLGLGSLSADRADSNLAGTMALAPALTGIGGSRRHVISIGALATALAGLTCWFDGVPLLTALIRCAILAVVTAVIAVVAGARQRQLAQLQDRRQAARTLQAAMLTELPELDHLQLASRYLPASSGDQVGGDWYDALVDADGSTILVIGDVVGHDIRAAAAMGQVRAVLRTCAVQGGQSPAQVLSATEVVLERLGLEVLASALVVRIDHSPLVAERGLGRITWSSAGHSPPILIIPAPLIPAPLIPAPRPALDRRVPARDAGAGTPTGHRSPDSGGFTSGARALVLHHGADRELHSTHARGPVLDLTGVGDGDVLLGVGAGAERIDHSCQVPPAGTLLLYTDGLVERRDADLEAGTRTLCRVLEAEAARELEDLLDEGLRHLVGAGHGDDVAVLAVRTRREGAPGPVEKGLTHPAIASVDRESAAQSP